MFNSVFTLCSRQVSDDDDDDDNDDDDDDDKHCILNVRHIVLLFRALFICLSIC